MKNTFRRFLREQMDHNIDRDLNGLRKETADELDYSRRDRDERGPREPVSFRIKGKTIVLLGAGVIILIILIALLPRGGSEPSRRNLSTLVARLGQLEEKLTLLEEMEARIASLEQRERAFEWHREDRSTETLAKQLDVLSKKVDLLEKQVIAAASKTRSVSTGKTRASDKADWQYHQVEKGDSLYRIAERYEISVEELCRLNNINHAHPIYPGQKLLVAPTSAR
jgi:hypothetical protein